VNKILSLNSESDVTGKERLALLIATLAIPATVAAILAYAAGESLYHYYYPAPPEQFHFTAYDGCRSISVWWLGFTFSFIAALAISPLLIWKLRIFASFGLHVLPLLFGILFCLQLLAHALSLPRGHYREAIEFNPFFPFQMGEFFGISFQFFLFMWHAKILIRGRLGPMSRLK
jgi:hypothetical protein